MKNTKDSFHVSGGWSSTDHRQGSQKEDQIIVTGGKEVRIVLN